MYQLRNVISGSVYIGQALDVERRFAQHRALLRCGYHHSSAVREEVQRYGAGAWRFEVLERCEPDKLREREAVWIERAGALALNCTDGHGALSRESRQRRAVDRSVCLDWAYRELAERWRNEGRARTRYTAAAHEFWAAVRARAEELLADL